MNQNFKKSRLNDISIKLLTGFFFAAFLIISLSTQAQTVSTAAGDGSQAGTDNHPTFTNYYTGIATGTPLFRPMGVATDDSGNFYIADQVDNIIQKITVATGNMTQVAGDGYDWGTGSGGYSGDNGQATASELYLPTGLAVDDSGNIYIADQQNSLIRKVTKATGIITTFAGNYSLGAGFSGDAGKATAAQLSQPFTVALDDSGNLYIADAGNACIREVNKKTNIIQTIAGRGAGGGTDGAGDGTPATNAVFSGPDGLAVDDSGNVYIADQYGMAVRKITIANGDIITRIAGSGSGGYSGDTGPATQAQLYYPSGVAVDDSGNVYIGDSWNNRIRKVTKATGIITTYAGNGYLPWWTTGNNPPLGGYVNGPAASAELSGPSGIALDPCGNLYEADYYNNVIREVSVPANSTTATTTAKPSLSAICTGQSVSFTDSSNFNATNWKWYFHGGTPDSSISTNPTGIQYTAAGTYDVIITASNFCVGGITDTLTHITVGSAGVLTFAFPSPNVCNGQSVTLKVAENDTSFTWSPSAGLSDTTGDSVLATPSVTTTYTVTGKNSGGCVSTGMDTVTIITAPPLYINSPASTCAGQPITLSVDATGSGYIWSPSSTLNSSNGDSVIATPLEQTTYTVSGIDSLGCIVSAMDTIHINKGVNKPTITDTDNVLTSSATQSNQWYRNDSKINGATNETYTATDTGCYWSVATNLVNGCSTISDTICLTSLAGINRLFINPNLLSIYPNPTGGELFVNISPTVADVKDWNLQITDVLGRMVYTRLSLNYTNDIDLSNLSGGVYFIIIINNTARAVYPVVKQN
jgi:sugar lactone lactonase YvrE